MDASQQFWVSEDLLEHLLPMLDLPTLVAFASVNPLVVSLLSRPQRWRQLLKRIYQFPKAEEVKEKEWYSVEAWLEKEYFYIPLKAPMIANILNMMECQESGLLAFLDFIEQVVPVRFRDDDDEFESKIKLNLGGSSRMIGDISFSFLEQVVSHLDSKVMELEEVMLRDLPLQGWEGFVERALVSQLSRQQAALKVLKINHVGCASDIFFSLTEKSSSWSVEFMSLQSSPFREEKSMNWRRLAEVSTRGEISIIDVGLSLGCAEAVRKVWLATKSALIFAKGNGSELAAWISKEEGESGWGKILELIEEGDQIATRKRKRDVKWKRQKKNKT